MELACLNDVRFPAELILALLPAVQMDHCFTLDAFESRGLVQGGAAEQGSPLGKYGMPGLARVAHGLTGPELHTVGADLVRSELTLKRFLIEVAERSFPKVGLLPALDFQIRSDS